MPLPDYPVAGLGWCARCRVDHEGGAGNSALVRAGDDLVIAARPAVLNLDILPDGPAQLLQPLKKRRIAPLRDGIVCCERHEHADPPHALALLRARRERPGGGRAPRSVMKSRRVTDDQVQREQRIDVQQQPEQRVYDVLSEFMVPFGWQCLNQRAFQRDRQYWISLCQNTSRATKAASTSVANII